MILPAAVSALPIYIPAALLLGLLGFITIIAWMTRATAVAVLAMILCIVATGLLVLWTSYLGSVQGAPFDQLDRVLLRLVAAAFVGILIIQGLVAKRCWQTDRARMAARKAAALSQRTSAEDFDQKWLLSLLQKKVAESREKVSTSAEDVPTADEASIKADSITS
jgi:hypothetical protein